MMSFMPPSGKVFCDKCGLEFNLRKVKIEEERLVRNRLGYFFQCPHCQAKYPFASITKRGQTLLQSLKVARRDVKQAIGNRKRYPIVLSRYDKILAKYQKEVGGAYPNEEVIVND